MRTRLLTLILAVAILTGAGTGLVACGDDDEGTTTTTTTAGGSTTEAESTTSTDSSTSEPAADVDVLVYFARDEAVAAAGRTATGPALARGALEALLAGPEGIETEIGMTSAIPDGTTLNEVTIEDGVATVDLSAEFQSGGGSLSMQLRVAQVVFTLTQFDTVDSVDILLDGDEVDGIGGEGVPASDLDRTDLTNVTPAILVESPTPGAEVTSPVTVSGIANTFEANVRWAVTDPEGLILEEGFTTATAGNGTWGDFSFEVAFTTERSGLGAVILWQDDMESGEQRDVVEVPVTMS